MTSKLKPTKDEKKICRNKKKYFCLPQNIDDCLHLCSNWASAAYEPHTHTQNIQNCVAFSNICVWVWTLKNVFILPLFIKAYSIDIRDLRCGNISNTNHNGKHNNDQSQLSVMNTHQPKTSTDNAYWTRCIQTVLIAY